MIIIIVNNITVAVVVVVIVVVVVDVKNLKLIYQLNTSQSSKH